jgi:protein-disulfide isomerase
MAPINPSGGTATAGGSVEGTFYGEVNLGSADAPAVLREYASPTCGHCAHLHEEAIKALKERTKTGELRIEFREFMTPPRPIAMASFQIARCAGEDKYFDVLEDVFENQRGIMIAAQQGAARASLTAVAARHGLTEAEFNTCIRDQKVLETINGFEEEGLKRGVSSTPTLFLNGKEVNRSDYTLARLNALIDELNGIEPAAPAQDTDEAGTPASEE